ncbi:hypothetical protein SAM40697_6724 [Streptomyces ambofaciens]|uniref:Secreted protein n=1 Tax=Streptomyces ambofaciens TaxID=1889 RepID=A0ABN4PGM5_STRAM|nr:hypothetical protein SAM40697_6724 [Streptomyces ambofaciens]
MVSAAWRGSWWVLLVVKKVWVRGHWAVRWKWVSSRRSPEVRKTSAWLARWTYWRGTVVVSLGGVFSPGAGPRLWRGRTGSAVWIVRDVTLLPLHVVCGG